jgi:hypothetical protein
VRNQPSALSRRSATVSEKKLKNKRLTYIVLVILFSSQSPGPHAFINSVVQALGQIVAKNAEVNGVAVSSGTTLFDNSLVETGEDSAFIHISNGSVVEMGKQSSAHFEKTELNTIKIELLRGALRFQEEGGRTVTVPDPTKSPPDQLEEAEPGEGLVAVLTRDAFKGVTILNVNETSRIAPTSPILIVSPDGTNKEIHYIKTVKKQTIEMTAGLQLPFPTESLV